MVNTYAEALDYLYRNLPMFQRVGVSAYKKDLTNTIELCRLLGDPQNKFKCIHVAGTNGKGSSSHMLASIFQASGYKTGLYTSPHLKEFTERIKIDGSEISHAFVVDFINRIIPAIESIHPSFFEITVAMAFEYFSLVGVDVAVIEVGLGGRLDSTNVITPELSLITNIGWDHKDILGDTLQQIAYEKAGIIKPLVPVVISERKEQIDEVFIKQAAEMNAPITFACDHIEVVQRLKGGKTFYDARSKGQFIIKDLLIPLQGYYQQKNLTGVLQAVGILMSKGWHITPSSLSDGLMNVVSKTGLKGRWQKLGESPLIICDTGHNIDGLREVVHQIHAQTFEKLHIVFGVVKDKDLDAVLNILPKDAFYYFCEAKIPRALDAALLAEAAATRGLHGVVIQDVNEAVEKAKASASSKDMIFIGGSTFVVAELNNL